MAKADGALSRPEAMDGTRDGTRLNAFRHGVLSRDTVLPWEDEGEYRALLAALAEEHRPEGATEAHLVEELAGTIWRKRRLRLAEAALARQGIGRTVARLRREAAPTADAGEAVLDALHTSPDEMPHAPARTAPGRQMLPVPPRQAPDDRLSIRVQALGDAHDPERLQNLARYEVHLDRKLERTLALLLRLQQLKR
jgi:hypothetical protein